MYLQTVIKRVDLITNQRQLCWKQFLSSSNIILQEFSRLGEKENLPSLEILEVVEIFACL